MGGGGVVWTWRSACMQEQPRGLKFPTPGAVLLFGLHVVFAAWHGGTSASQ